MSAEDEVELVEELDLEGADLEAAVAEVEAAEGVEAEADEEVPEGSPPPEDEYVEDADETEENVDAEEGEEKMNEDLQDSVEGSLRLKRLMSKDGDIVEPGAKRRREEDDSDISPAVLAKAKQLLTRWDLLHDVVCTHILKHLTLEDLEGLSTFAPTYNHQNKTPCELLAKQVAEVLARKLPGGGGLDCMGAFKFRFKLDITTERTLRSLPHRELRYIFDNHDGTKPIAEVMEDAKKDAADDDPLGPEYPSNVWPNNPGPAQYGRFVRLELIDPTADSCVFGDANLTFSLRLVKHRSALGHVGRVIATTFEDRPTLRERYKEIDESIETLESHYAEVFHGVDCTRIALNPDFKGLESSFGSVYYNFPHSGAVGGFFDGHPIVNWRHENLMRLFFRALRSFVKPGGMVKVASNMGATGVRYSYIVGGALQNEFVHAETMPFLEWHLHRYGRSYGDKRDIYKRPDAKNNESYNAQSGSGDMVYCFRYEPTGKKLGQQMVRMPPTLFTLMGCEDGPFRNLGEQAKMNLAKQLNKRFVTEISGTHVG